MRTRVLGAITALEGGQMRSITLRNILKRHYGVTLGDYAYGSLAKPGMADRGTRIGRYASIGPNVRRIGAAHPISAPTLHPLWYNPTLGMVNHTHDVARTPCDIGPDVWIGANVVILPGCLKIGTGAVIGANAVVTKDVPDFAIMVGIPAKQINTRLTAALRERLLRDRPWELPPDQADAYFSDLSENDELQRF